MLLNCWWLLHEHLFCFSAYNLFVFQGSFPKTKHHSSVKCTTEGMFWWVHNKSTLDDYLGSSGSWKPQWMKDTPSATRTLHLAYNTNNKSSKLLPWLASAYWEHGPSAYIIATKWIGIFGGDIRWRCTCSHLYFKYEFDEIAHSNTFKNGFYPVCTFVCLCKSTPWEKANPHTMHE